MDPFISNLRVLSYNLHGLNQGANTLHELCNSHETGIIFIQEHWQAPSNMYKILSFSNEFVGFGISAMENKVSCGPLQGRPYGGAAVLVRNDLARFVNNVVCDERFAIVCINDYCFISLYLPCKASLSTDSYTGVLNDTLEQIAVHVDTLGPKFIIFGGDLNTDLRCKCVATDAIFSFAAQMKLVVCSEIIKPTDVDYTFHSHSLNQFSWLDWMLISNDLSHRLITFNIIESALNLSDHLPIIIEIPPILTGKENNQTAARNDDHNKSVLKLRWDKANLNLYYEKTRLNLQPIMDNFVPLYGQVLDSLALFNANLFCRNEMPSHRAGQYEECKRIIDEFYPLFVAALIDASTVTVPVIKVNALKHWWSEELTELKQRSIDTFHVWKDAGKPRSGTVFDLYMQNKYAYKLCINKMKNDSAQEITNDLHEALCDKDNSGFWKIWNSKFNIKKRNKPLTVNNLTNSQDIAEAFSNYFGNVCQPNSEVFNANKRSKFEIEIQSYVGDFVCPDDFFSVELLGKIVCELKLGRAPGIDGLTTEHFLHCHPSAIVLLTYLCNLILLCGHACSLSIYDWDYLSN